MSQTDQWIDNLFNLLEPHEAFVKKSEGWLGMAQLIAPAFVLMGIKRANTTGGLPVVPFLFMTMITSLNVLHSQSLENEAMYKAQLTAFSCSIVYLTTYFYFVPTNQKSLQMKIILVGVGFVSAIFLYSRYEIPSAMPQKFELIIRSFLYFYYCLGFLGVVKAFVDRCTAHMPFEMILTGTLMTVNKAATSILANNRFLIMQFAFFLFVHTLQLLCFVLFPWDLDEKAILESKEKKEAAKKEKKEPEKVKKNKKSKKE